MDNILRQLFKTLSASIALLALSVTSVAAQITNPALQGELTNYDLASEGTAFANYFATLWKAVLAIGAIATLILFIWGAMEWIVSGGDKGKLENARNRITQAIVGLIILVGAFVILQFLSTLLFGESFNILEPTIPEALNRPPGF